MRFSNSVPAVVFRGRGVHQHGRCKPYYYPLARHCATSSPSEEGCKSQGSSGLLTYPPTGKSQSCCMNIGHAYPLHGYTRPAVSAAFSTSGVCQLGCGSSKQTRGNERGAHSTRGTASTPLPLPGVWQAGKPSRETSPLRATKPAVLSTIALMSGGG